MQFVDTFEFWFSSQIHLALEFVDIDTSNTTFLFRDVVHRIVDVPNEPEEKTSRSEIKVRYVHLNVIMFDQPTIILKVFSFSMKIFITLCKILLMIC